MLRRRRQLRRRARLPGAEAHLQGARVRDRSRLGRQWALNASYTLSYSKGNAEGPVNSDTNFADTGRTEAFDDPWVNFGGDGYLPNDRRHQIKVRGAYALGEHWQFGATLNAAVGSRRSARSASAIRSTAQLPQLLHLHGELHRRRRQRVYELHPRGSEGRTPWIFDLGAERDAIGTRSRSPTCSVKLAVYNLLNQQRDDARSTTIFEVDHRRRQPGLPAWARAISRRATRC